MPSLFNILKEAYEVSTHSYNRFKEVVESISWDESFYADGEHYFVKGAFVFTTPSLDPFDMPWNPSAVFLDGSVIEF